LHFHHIAMYILGASYDLIIPRSHRRGVTLR
jgi:hypothetical protein